MKKDLKAVIFDMDGVIVDSERALLVEWKTVADELGLPNIEQVYISVCGTTREMTERMVKEAYGQDFPFDELDRKVYHMRDERYPNGLPLKSGIRELLTALKEHGILVALATSTDGERARRQIDILVTGDMVTRSKPDPEIFLIAIDKQQVPASSAVIIEDSFNGVRAGRNAGAEVIMVPDLKQPNDEIRGCYDHVFPDLHEVRKYLLEED